MTNKKAVFIILVLSIATHFAFFGYPDETVFDEVHFGKFVSGYYTGEYYFDIHPPLGKLIIAGFAKLFNIKPEFNFAEIGEKFPDKKYLVLRFLPVLAGTLLPVIIFLLILELGLSRIAAFAGGLFIIFENAILTQSRLMLLDPFLLLFGFASLLFYFKSRSALHTARYRVLMSVFAGLAVSIKWTGLSFIAIPIIIEMWEYRMSLSYKNLIRYFKWLISFVGIVLTVYFSVFLLHFALLPKPGPGDAFMKPGFRDNSIVKNILDLNIEMYRSNQRLTATHPYNSSWYEWPFMVRPIYYWVKDNARIYLFGNPVIWWSSTIAIAFGIKYLVLSINKRKLDEVLAILFGGYVINLLPFIGIKRVMFLYHYLIALIFAIMILCYLIDKNKNSRNIFTVIVAVAIAAFIFFAPLSYGLPLSDKSYEARVWFSVWR
ncbi:MAG: phospholipid carrier-dependent glycosyltransferase [Patescibacteria group bacterium]